MALLNKLFSKSDSATMERGEPVSVSCPHTTLTPRWDSVEDMGNEDKATGYQCQSCGEDFTPLEGYALRRDEAERTQNVLKV